MTYFAKIALKKRMLKILHDSLNVRDQRFIKEVPKFIGLSRLLREGTE